MPKGKTAMFGGERFRLDRTFAARVNANSHAQRKRKEGYKARVRKVMIKGKLNAYRVYIRRT